MQCEFFSSLFLPVRLIDFLIRISKQRELMLSITLIGAEPYPILAVNLKKYFTKFTIGLFNSNNNSSRVS